MNQIVNRSILIFLSMCFSPLASSAVLEPDSYTAWYGDINNDGIEDIYFQAKSRESFVLIASDIIIPIPIVVQGDYMHMEMLGTSESGMGLIESSEAIDPIALGLFELVVLTGDFNGDGSLQLVVQSPNLDVESFVLTSSGSSLSVAQSLGASSNSVFISKDIGDLSVEDINGDGREDIVLYDNENIIRVVLGSDSGLSIPTEATGSEEGVEDATVEVIMKDFSKALVDGNPQKALNYIEPNQRGRYSAVFADLGDDLPVIAQGFSSPIRVSLNEEGAEFVLSQTVNAQQYVHICSFIKSVDGRWYINSL